MTQPLLQSYLFRDLPHHMVAYARELAERMPVRGRVLDLGCGSNTSLARFRTEEREVWGADFREHPELDQRDWFRLLDPSGAIPFADNSFDLVHSLWVLEHVERPERFLAEVQRVLKPGGFCVAHTISGSHYVAWITRAFALLPHTVTQQVVRRLYGRPCHDTFRAYYRLNTQSQLEKCSRRLNLSLVEMRRHVDAGYFSFLGPLQNLAVLADWLLGALSPGWGHIYLTATLQKTGVIGPTRATVDGGSPRGPRWSILTRDREPCYKPPLAPAEPEAVAASESERADALDA